MIPAMLRSFCLGVVLLFAFQADVHAFADDPRPASFPLTLVTTSAPATTGPARDNGLTEFVAERFKPNEANYFLAGAERPNAKFQISVKYQMFNDEGTWAKEHPWITGFYAAYNQTSLWDLGGDSAPFFDTSYRPEIFWVTTDLLPNRWPGKATVDLQIGLDHESNGQDGVDSRTANHLYIQPAITFGDKRGFFFTIAPRLFAYIGDFDDTPDIEQYRGYADLKFIIGQAVGLQAAVLGRLSDDFERGSIQLDVSYPLRKIMNDNVDLYLHAQLFNGYGETLLNYRDTDTSFRIGFSLVR